MVRQAHHPELVEGGRNYPSLTKRGEGRFSNDYVNSILGPFIKHRRDRKTNRKTFEDIIWNF
jgi:hypothetical protein